MDLALNNLPSVICHKPNKQRGKIRETYCISTLLSGHGQQN